VWSVSALPVVRPAGKDGALKQYQSPKIALGLNCRRQSVKRSAEHHTKSGHGSNGLPLPSMPEMAWEIARDESAVGSEVGSGGGIQESDPQIYLIGREPVMRISTSLLAVCCQSGLDDM
jgi:hypothetical protein